MPPRIIVALTLPPPLHDIPVFPHSQQYLECEHAQFIFGEGGARAVSYPVWKLCALLSLPRFGALQGRLVAHVSLLASLWLPRDGSSLIDFFQDSVELLQVRGSSQGDGQQCVGGLGVGRTGFSSR